MGWYGRNTRRRMGRCHRPSSYMHAERPSCQSPPTEYAGNSAKQVAHICQLRHAEDCCKRAHKVKHRVSKSIKKRGLNGASLAKVDL
eukprot:2737199-Amphidinium_carterae.1